MGSSQSQPLRAGSTSAPNAQPARTPLPTPAHRISTLRRLSTFGRSSSQNSIPKRDRTSSAGSSIDARIGQEQKKRRTEGDTDGDQVMESSSAGGMEIATTSIDITSPVGLTPSLPTSPGPPVDVTHPARFPIPSPTRLPLSTAPVSPHPQPIEPSVIVSPPLSPSFTPNDPLLSERLQTLSTIRQAFSQRSATSTSPRPSLNALPSSNSIRNRLSRTPTSESGRLSDRILSIFGPSTSDSAAQASPLPAAAPQLPLPTPDSIEEVTRRMNQAQSELAETQRRIDEIQARLNTERNARTQTQLQLAQHQREVDSIRSRLQAEINAVSGATTAAAPAATGPAGPRRIPAGAVLVIQGLAQTLTAEPPAPQRNRQTASGAADDASVPSQRRRPGPSIGRRRRNSESNATPPSGSTSTQAGGSEEEENNSIESQARMISGLLTVAAAATATTLLAPASTQPEATRPNQANAISSFLDRFRSNRGRTAPTVESALGEYLRNMLNSHGRSDAPAPLPVAEGTEPDSTGTSQQISSDFQAFLETLQTELVEAVRAFAGPTAPATEDEEVVSGTGDGEPAQTPSIGADASSTAQEGASETQPPAIPTFHRQAGQISAESPTNRFGIIHGENGEPRRMNFFRAHMFPPVQSSSPTSMTGPDDPDGMVPCVFVGVRSIVHDPAMTTEDLVSHPNFPFLDGTAPSEDDEETETTSIPSTLSSNATLPPVQEDEPVARPGTPHPAPSPASRSLRQRILERLTRNRPARPTRPVNTYLVYVIGGYYPRSHPVLSIPNLITGGPLTDEEMQLIGEMMGPVKPPVATKDDIENSGLSVIDGSEVSLRAEKGEILDICLDRCLICLSDYEQGEQCRILKCRHAYHKDCVDQWLSTGRNSCPACRDEAVETKKAPVPDTAAIAGTSAPTTSASATRDPGEDMDMLD